MSGFWKVGSNPPGGILKGSILTRKKGVHLLRLPLGTRALKDGTKKRVTKTETYHGTKDGAERRLRELVQQYESGGVIDRDKTALGDFLNEWMDLCKSKSSKSTKRCYSHAITAHIEPVLGNTPLYCIGPMDIQRLYRSLEVKGLSRISIHHCRTVLQQALEQAKDWRRISYNPAIGIKIPGSSTKRKKVVKAMSEEALRIFLPAMREHPDGFIYRWAFFSGARPGEYLGLDWPCVDWMLGGWRVEKAMIKANKEPAEWSVTKTAAGHRTIGMPPHMMAELKAHRAKVLERRLAAGDTWHAELDLVFGNRVGWFRSESWLNQQFKKILKTLGITEDLDVYSLRHAHASEMLRLGKHPKVVQERLGHSNISETMDTYSHKTVPMDMQAAVDLGVAFPY